ncbi:potassium channel family protein [Orenia marismortui]|uniref:potassium channel family protein n=1 Tax=Orenia marismortui TaxID=46469 RepID=UPI000366A604|nr:potassium channel family protein [Orenia marismortui]
MFNVLVEYFKKFKFKLDRHTFHWLILVVVIILISSAILIMIVEPNDQFNNFVDALWWAIVTVTTVGYGDKYAVTLAGRIISIIVMLLGIGMVGGITAKLADIFIEFKRRRELGELKAEYKNHIIVCGWSSKTREIIEQVLNEDLNNKQLVLIANIERDPFPDNKLVHFVRGAITEEEALKKAGVMKAKTAIILNEDENDATTILAVLTVESLNPSIYTIAEITHSENKIHLKNANVDEIVVNNELNSQLLVRSAIYSGTSQIIGELLSNETGNEIYMFASNKEDINKSFLDLFTKYKERDNIILIGIKREDQIITNPNNNEMIKEADKLIYIANKKKK